MLEKLLKGIKGNWKTTLVAVLGAIGVICVQMKNLLDGDPATVFNWDIMYGTGVVVLIGLFAKDGDKKSDELGL